jgi:hypothetical protein
MIIPDKKWQKYLFAANIVKSCIDGIKKNKLKKCEQTRNFMAGMFAQLIFNCPDVHTGMISPAGRIQKTQKGSATSDHFRGRKGSGFVLFDQAMKGASIFRLALIIASRCRVHWISSEENNKLRLTASQNPYKTKKEIQEEYSSLNIVLEGYVPMVNRIYDYHIEGIVYTSMKEIKAKYNLSDAGVTYRCESPNYSDWQKVKIA